MRACNLPGAQDPVSIALLCCFYSAFHLFGDLGQIVYKIGNSKSCISFASTKGYYDEWSIFMEYIWSSCGQFILQTPHHLISLLFNNPHFFIETKSWLPYCPKQIQSPVLSFSVDLIWFPTKKSSLIYCVISKSVITTWPNLTWFF